MVWDPPFGRTDPRDFVGVDRDLGSGSSIPPNFILPAAPKDVNVVVSHVGVRPSLTITWTDENVIQPALPTVHNWQVRYVDEKVAGTVANEKNFPNRALELSRYLNTVATTHRGEQLVYVHTQEGLKDGYVIVVGVSEFAIAGPPSMPWLVRVESSSKALAPDVSDLDAIFYVETVAGAQYINFTPIYRGPADIFFFRGVQVYWIPYVIDDLAEMGNMDTYAEVSGSKLQTSKYRRYPLSSNLSLGTGTISTIAGSPDVVRVSGTAFDPGWAGRSIYVDDRDDMAQYFLLPGAWPKRGILSVADANNMTLDIDSNQTGTFSFYVLRAITAYYVAVSNYGSRRLDITGAPSLVLS